jgi:uncharacterized damage-inducible protein DinB
MEVHELLVELFGRVSGHVHGVLADLDTDELLAAPATGTNPIAWLIWHLTRVQDHHMAEIMERDQIWVEGGWARRFGLDPDPQNHGYGHTPAQVASVRPESPTVLITYYDAVAARTREFLDTVTAADLDRVIDRRWDPPVTLGVRLVSIADDDIQHAGQAAYVRGLLHASKGLP